MITSAEVEAFCDVVDELVAKLGRLERAVQSSSSADSIRHWAYLLVSIRSRLKRIVEYIEEERFLAARSEACDLYTLIQKRLMTLSEDDAVGQSLRGELVSISGLTGRICSSF